MRSVSIALAPALAALVACSRPEPQPVRPVVQAERARASAPSAAPAAVTAVAAPGAAREFGSWQPGDAPTARLGQILQNPDQYRNRTLKIDGTVVAVCQERGCWMEIRDEATQAHVRMHGHSFFVPRDVAQRHAQVLGTLVAAHPPTGCDNEAREATGQVAQVELDATGVRVD